MIRLTDLTFAAIFISETKPTDIKTKVYLSVGMRHHPPWLCLHNYMMMDLSPPADKEA